MYSEGVMDLMEMIMVLPFATDPKAKLDAIETKAKERYLPVFEKVSVYCVYFVHIQFCGLIRYILLTIHRRFIHQ